MTGPRKRPFHRMGACLATLMVLGTVHSSLAAPNRAGNGAKNHSTSVNKQKKTPGTGVAGNDASAAAATPRAGAVEMARTSSPLAQPAVPASEEAAIRDAIARRRAWNDLRRPLSAPAKVKDPPVVVKVDRPAVEAAPAGAPVAMAPRANDRSPTNEDLIREALRNRGVPYVWGGASRGGFDCSGFVLYVFRKKRGIALPHSASAQARMGTPVARENLQPGDLVFFATYRPSISHVGIYVGDNQFIHAANRRSDVHVSTLTGYYANRYRGARRVTPAPIEFTPEDLRMLNAEPSETPPAP